MAQRGARPRYLMGMGHTNRALSSSLMQDLAAVRANEALKKIMEHAGTNIVVDAPMYAGRQIALGDGSREDVVRERPHVYDNAPAGAGWGLPEVAREPGSYPGEVITQMARPSMPNGSWNNPFGASFP